VPSSNSKLQSSGIHAHNLNSERLPCGPFFFVQDMQEIIGSINNSKEQRAVRVLARQDAEARQPLAGEVCISITNPNQSPASLADYADVLRLGFHDTDRVGGGFTVMSRAHARNCLAFGERHASAPLTVHCQFGASRSVAVGLFLAAWFGRPLEVTATDVLMPNPWVLNQLRAAALYRSLSVLDARLLKCALFGATDYLLKKTDH
jgi:predicted protein tyrosine phosphatase